MIIELKRYHFMIGFGLAGTLAVAGYFFGDNPSKKVKDVRSDQRYTAYRLPLSDAAADHLKLGLQKIQNKVTGFKVSKSIKKNFSGNSQATAPDKPTVRGGSTIHSGRKKTVAITFDDGPHPKFTERILKILNDHSVPSTFFVVGKQAERHPDLIQKIFRDGHEIANHTYTHPDLRRLEPEILTYELERTHRIVESITDQKMRYFRPPGGRYNSKVIESARNIGYDMILWTVITHDHENPPAAFIKRRVLEKTKDNGIILLHSGVENTLAALPGMIQSLKNNGFTFVTLSHLKSQTDTTSVALLSQTFQ